jgi:hypothetical protein
MALRKEEHALEQVLTCGERAWRTDILMDISGFFHARTGL